MSFLRGEAKRPASLKNTELGCTVPFLSIFVLVGIAMLVGSIVMLKNDLDLKNDGVLTQGKMIDHDLSENSEGTGYYITYFFVANDRTYTKEQSVSSDLFYRFTPDAPVTIRYLPTNPDKSRIEGEGMSPWAFLGFSVCWMSFVMLAVWGIVHQADQNELLVKKGQLIEGTVVSASSYNDSDDGYSIKLKYRFVSPDGGQMVVKTYQFAASDHKGEALPVQGTCLKILYYTDKHHQVL
ncbi:MAG: DUF3592 domain-containing protein [Anaerolineae bacterium]|nr:DUF3592 domain-containing protein [Anaerolineae bacterium]